MFLLGILTAMVTVYTINGRLKNSFLLLVLRVQSCKYKAICQIFQNINIPGSRLCGRQDLVRNVARFLDASPSYWDTLRKPNNPGPASSWNSLEIWSFQKSSDFMILGQLMLSSKLFLEKWYSGPKPISLSLLSRSLKCIVQGIQSVKSYYFQLCDMLKIIFPHSVFFLFLQRVLSTS